MLLSGLKIETATCNPIDAFDQTCDTFLSR